MYEYQYLELQILLNYFTLLFWYDILTKYDIFVLRIIIKAGFTNATYYLLILTIITKILKDYCVYLPLLVRIEYITTLWCQKPINRQIELNIPTNKTYFAHVGNAMWSKQ